MHVIRHRNQSTTHNLTEAVAILNNKACVAFTLFASPVIDEESPDGSNANGPSTNYPLVVALAKLKLTESEELFYVFDGVFLTAARQPRDREVTALIDECVNSGKATYVAERAPFTAELLPPDAAQTLQNLVPQLALTEQSRANFYHLVSSSPERRVT